jgi:hypothetical protein
VSTRSKDKFAINPGFGGMTMQALRMERINDLVIFAVPQQQWPPKFVEIETVWHERTHRHYPNHIWDAARRCRKG